MGYKVAVVGATVNVGREILNILAERHFPIDKIVALASRRSLGTKLSFGDEILSTKDLFLLLTLLIPLSKITFLAITDVKRSSYLSNLINGKLFFKTLMNFNISNSTSEG